MRPPHPAEFETSDVGSLHVYLGEGVDQSWRWTMEWNACSSNRRIWY